jgi:nitroreductase
VAAIRSRRNLRSYRQPAIAPQDLDRILQAGWCTDLGQATMSAMLAAADLGIGSAHAGVGAHSTRWCTLAAGSSQP